MLPDSLQSIGDEGLEFCNGLASIAIPSSVLSIGIGAFYSCINLTNVTISSGVNYIGEEAFGKCFGLAKTDVDLQNQFYGSTDGVLFNKNQSKLILYPPAKGGSYSIPQGVTTIDSHAFAYTTSLNSLTVPNSVTTDGFKARIDVSIFLWLLYSEYVKSCGCQSHS